MKNFGLKGVLVGKFGTCTKAVQATGGKLHPTRLSRIIQGRLDATQRDREVLAQILTPEELRRAFGMNEPE
jgi:hypothetical protein